MHTAHVKEQVTATSSASAIAFLMDGIQLLIQMIDLDCLILSILLRDGVLCRFDARGLHSPFFFWNKRTHFIVAKYRHFCEIVLHEVARQFHILLVSPVIERTCSGAAVYAQETMSSYLPESEGRIPVIDTEPSMDPIACLRVLLCFASDPSLFSISRGTCYCGAHNNQSEQDYDAFHDRNLASDAVARKTCLTSAVSGHSTPK